MLWLDNKYEGFFPAQLNAMYVSIVVMDRRWNRESRWSPTLPKTSAFSAMGFDHCSFSLASYTQSIVVYQRHQRFQQWDLIIVRFH